MVISPCFGCVVPHPALQSVADSAIDFVLPGFPETKIRRVNLDHIKPVCAINTSLIIIYSCTLLIAVHAKVLNEDVVIIEKEVRIPQLCFSAIHHSYRSFIRKTDFPFLEVIPDLFLSIRFVRVPQLVLIRHKLLERTGTYLNLAVPGK